MNHYSFTTALSTLLLTGVGAFAQASVSTLDTYLQPFATPDAL
jgi:hypothetical protein